MVLYKGLADCKSSSINGEMKLSTLWKPPSVNSENNKALSIPILRPWDKYGRCFHFAWIGFFISFLSWYAFPPLQATITADLDLSHNDISNANIVGLTSTMIVRLCLGPLCDIFGPRYVMVCTLLVGAIPTALVPLIKSKEGLFVVRFFVGFLGGTFIPCQMWNMAFFDPQIIGLATALGGGWGDAGAGVAFFTMPAIETSMRNRGYNISDAWKFSFLVGPLILIVFFAIFMLIFGFDCPDGKWANRTRPPVSAPVTEPSSSRVSTELKKDSQVTVSNIEMGILVEEDERPKRSVLLRALKVAFHPTTLLVALPYAVTFGGELAIEAILGGFYQSHARNHGEQWSQQLASNWGSMIGLMNIVCRPFGGLMADILYRKFGLVRVKKYWMLACGLVQGIFLLWLSLDKNLSIPGLIIGLAVMAVFMEAANGATFALVPHINKRSSGIVAGVTGAWGNVGGILFSLAFRYSTLNTNEAHYQRGLLGIAIGTLVVAIGCLFVPLSKHVS
uniref:Nitrate/nitrite transporter n=1 Tax=Blastobotrys adeninivorans TaxID=409370 RepID=A0A060T786_BLAAD